MKRILALTAVASILLATAPASKMKFRPLATAQTRAAEAKACPVCAQSGPQSIYAPLIELEESSGTEINLNCRSTHALDVTPTFYTIQGDAVTGDTFQMQPAEVKTIDLSMLMPANVRGRHDWGGMTLSYNGVALEMWGQLRLMHVNGGNSVDVTFSIPQDKRSNVRNAVWSMPKHGNATIALGNLSPSPITATLQFSNGTSEEVRIAGLGTAIVHKRSEVFRSSDSDSAPAGVTVTSNGSGASAGSLIAAGVIGSNDGTFASSIRFYDTENVAQPNLYATNFRLHSVRPRMLLRNVGSSNITASPRFLAAPGDPNTFVDVPSVNLSPGEIADVDLTGLFAVIQGRSDFNDASIQVLSSGAAGALIGALNGTDEVTGITYDVPLRDIGAIRGSTGAYPWRLDHDISTIVSVTNISPASSEFFVQINFEGGPYVLNPRRLESGETAVYDLRKIRDQQVADSKGRTIPRSIKGGQFKWFIRGAGSGRLIGRAEMIGRGEGISSSYSCAGGYCPPVFAGFWFDPSSLGVLVSGSGVFTAYEDDEDGAGNHYVYGASGSWTNSNSSIASMSSYGSDATMTGVSHGTDTASIAITYEQYVWDGLECLDMGPGYTDGEGNVLVGSISIGNVTLSSTTINGSGGTTVSVPLSTSSDVTNTNGTTLVLIITDADGTFALDFNPTSRQVSLGGGTTQTFTYDVTLRSGSGHCTFTPHVYAPTGITVTNQDKNKSAVVTIG
jgi:hypothetical protein